MEEYASGVSSYICDMPVIKGGALKYYSYGIVVTSTVFWYYIGSAIWMSVNKGSSGAIIAYLILGYLGITLMQFFGVYIQKFYNKCVMSSIGFGISIAIGIVFGLVVFGIVAGTTPESLPYVAGKENFTPVVLNGGLGTPPPPSVVKDDASSAPSNVKTCDKPDDKDDFVCDLYKNGQLVTTTVSE